MKVRKFFLGSSLLLIAICIVFACTKSISSDPPENKTPIAKKTVYKLSGVDQSSLKASDDESCGCKDHGGTYYTDVVWEMATCKSYCESGIGFRCGSAGFYICNDRHVEMCPAGHCPRNIIRDAASSRTMISEIKFYTDNTASFDLKKPIPEEEEGNNIFEVEEDRFVEFPEDVFVNDRHYAGFIAKKGNYFIDRGAGTYGYGLIYFSIELIPE
jgi:hypothetical protein